MSDVNSSGGIGFFGALALIFITLKLTNVISWSWWWVLAPVWVPATFVIIIGIILLGIVFIKET